MKIYAVELVRKADGSIVPYNSETAILYGTMEQAEEFIRRYERDSPVWESDCNMFRHIVSEIKVSGM